jgi:hypothetical protein
MTITEPPPPAESVAGRTYHAIRLADRLEATARDRDVSSALWDLAMSPETNPVSMTIIVEATAILAARTHRKAQP